MYIYTVMEFGRKENNGKGSSLKQFDNLEIYIRKIIDIYSSVEIKRGWWLTEREKDFLVATIIMVNSEITNPISTQGVAIYEKYFNNKVTKKTINVYLTNLQGKKWLKYDVGGRYVKLPIIFYGIQENDSFEFKINMSHEAFARSDSSGVEG